VHVKDGGGVCGVCVYCSLTSVALWLLGLLCFVCAGNNIGDDGATKLAEAIQSGHCSGLRDLHLYSTWYSDEGSMRGLVGWGDREEELAKRACQGCRWRVRCVCVCIVC
jgi:hypothetical protein